jgi:hypothetical protein
MKLLSKLALVCALFAPTLLTASAHAASPWDGTWKLNREKSQFTGTSFTYTKLPSGMWHVSFGSLGYDFAPDGKPYPFLDRSIATTMQGDHQITMTTMLNGKTSETTVETLSADGNTITDVTNGTHADGSPFTETTVSRRSGTGTGFAGKWVSTKEDNSTRSMFMISTGPDGAITMTYPTSKETVTAKTDGVPVALTGPMVPPDVTISYKKVSPAKLEVVVALKGKKVNEGYETLSADGKTLTEVSWAPGKMDEKTSAVYEKQ